MSVNSSFPDGATLAAVSSWHGGSQFDLRLQQVLEQFGWLGSFFVEPEQIGQEGRLTDANLRDLIETGHCVGLLISRPDDGADALAASRSRLEELTGREVISCAWPAGYSPAPSEVGAARVSGFRVGHITLEDDLRSAAITEWLTVPVTARARHAHDELRDRWARVEETGDGVFHLWGSSEECGDDDDIWAELECNLAWFCGQLHVWYTTLESVRSAVIL